LAEKARERKWPKSYSNIKEGSQNNSVDKFATAVVEGFSFSSTLKNLHGHKKFNTRQFKKNCPIIIALN
jgi:hypothetical protein